MSSPRISFTYQSTVASDSWWLRLVQLGIEDDTATLADAAELIDTLYSIDACTEDTTATEDPDSNTTDAVVETDVRRLVCSYDDQANIDVQMHIIRSHSSEPYRLALQGGELKTVETITEIATQTIILEDADSITLDYPVLGDFSASWDGAVYGASGRINPPIIRNGNTISFGATIKAGTITATYATEYDLATITILGVDGEPGQCTARGFFHGLVEELELETPEPADELGSCRVLWTVPSDPHHIECYRTVYVSQRCQCSHDELAGYSYEEVVDCPEYVKRCPGVLNECRHYLGTVVAPEYVECPDDMVEAVSVPAYYERICCDKPSVTLPQCKEQKTSWRGGLGINGGVEQARAIYGDDVEIVPVGPPDGICGTWTKRQRITAQQCCDGVPQLAWDTSISPEVMSPNSAVAIAVTGGRFPLAWEVNGVGFQFQATGSREAISVGRSVMLSALPIACGTATITVSDGCSTIVAYIRCTSGAWTTIYLSSAGLMGDSSGRLPYDGDPLPMIAGTGPIGTAGRYEQTAIVGKMKVWQRLQGGDGNTYNRKGFQTCVDICNGLLAIPPEDARFYLGPAFDYSHLCDTCGACTLLQSDITWWNYRLGMHSTINPDTAYSGWYNLYTIWILATGTQVWEWRC